MLASSVASGAPTARNNALATRAEWRSVLGVIQERQRAVGHRELAEVDVALDLVTELVLQLRRSGCTAVRCTARSAPGRRDSRRRCRTVVAQSQRRLGRILCGGTGDLVGAADGDQMQQGRRHRRRRCGKFACQPPFLGAQNTRTPIRMLQAWPSSARELCVSYPRRQPCRQPLMPPSWCARCDRRRVLPPECQRRHQLGASGHRAPPPPRSRSPRHRPGHAAGRAAGGPGPRGCPRSPGAVADVPEGHLAAARGAAAPNGQGVAGIRPRRRAPRVTGTARLRRAARRALPRRADRRGIPNGRSGFRAELRYRYRRTGGLGLDPSPAQPRRPDAGAVGVGDGKPCRTSHSSGPQMGAWSRHRRLCTVCA